MAALPVPLALTLVATGLGQSVWTAAEEIKLAAVTPVATADLGRTISFQGDTAVFGASGHDHSGLNNPGAAFVFERVGTVWTEAKMLVASDPEAENVFGASVALDGDTVIVGAWNDSHPGAVSGGSAYVFVRSGTDWVQQAKLVPAGVGGSDHFGSRLLLRGDTALVSATGENHSGGPQEGAVYEFVRSGTSWSERAQLVASDPGAFDNFGRGLAFVGDLALIGAPSANGARGTVYVFERTGTTWAETSKLAPLDLPDFSLFGSAISLWGDRALVTAPNASITGVSQAGTAYVFRRSGNTWVQEDQLVSATPHPDAHMGRSAILYGDTALLGAPTDDVLAVSGFNQGLIRVFARGGSEWTERSKSPRATPRPTTCSARASLWTAARSSPALPTTITPARRTRVRSTSSSCRRTRRWPTAPRGRPRAAAARRSRPPAPRAPRPFRVPVDRQRRRGSEGRSLLLWHERPPGFALGQRLEPSVRRAPGVKRASFLTGTGSSGSCSGTFTEDLNTLWSSNPTKNPGLATLVDAQLWYRDPLNTSNQTTSLSNAIEFLVGP